MRKYQELLRYPLGTHAARHYQESAKFKVPISWLEEFLMKRYDGVSLEDFMLDYTHDDGSYIYDQAKREGIIN